MLGRVLRAVFFGRGHNLVVGIVAGAIALAALVIGTEFYGQIHGQNNPRIIAYACAAAILVFGVLSTARISAFLGRASVLETVPAAAGAVRLFSAVIGYLITAFSILAVLSHSIEKLLVGAGVAGVILGIAAQQSLGNVFAGIVLVLARPFAIGDHIRIRSGALGGLFDAWVLDVSLTYVTVRTDDGILKVPNAAMLAAGVLQLTPESSPLPAPAAPAGVAGPAAPASSGGPAPAAPARDIGPAPGAPAPSSSPAPGAPDGVESPGPGLMPPPPPPPPPSTPPPSTPAGSVSFPPPPPPPPPPEEWLIDDPWFSARET